MTTKLELLLLDIDPSRTIDAVNARVDRAINSFHVPAGVVTDHHQFQDMMTRLFVHIECGVLSISTPRAVHKMDWCRCYRMLGQIYGSEGEYGAAQKAISGHDGGLYSVIRNLGKQMASEYAHNEIAARVAAHWRGWTTEEKLGASAEYVARFKRFLPDDVTEQGAARLRVFFPRFLENHPFLVQKVGRVGK
jgi:hypothetical protein